VTFWLDDHLDPKLAAWLGSTFGIIAKTLTECGLHGAKDPVLYDAARRLGSIVMVTKDSDFVDLVQRKGHPPQVLWLNFPNMATIRIQVKLRATFPDALKLLEAGEPIVEIE